MLRNRIRRFYVEPSVVAEQTEALGQERPQLVSVASFAISPGFAAAAGVALAGVYRAASEQARREVAARSERRNQAYRWN